MNTDRDTASDKDVSSSGDQNKHSPEEMRTTFKEIDPRPRINQPKGYEDSQYSSSLIRGRRHDYIFLPQGYKDPDTGKEYKAGYYDESGNFYERVIIKAGKMRETLACCDFCGTQIKLKWESGALNSCPNCGATLHEVPDKTIYDHQLRPVPANPVFKERPGGGHYRSDYGTSYSLGGIIAISAAVIVLAIIIMYVSKQMWGAVAISAAMSFAAFLVTFAAVAVGMALEGIGDTIRVSLTDEPVKEVYAAKDILKAMGLNNEGIKFISCPTCGRTRIDLIGLAKQAEERLKDCKKNITVAIMGCAVNGPGEAREADIGIAGGHGTGLIFKKGEIIKKVPEEKLLDELIKEIELTD